MEAKANRPPAEGRLSILSNAEVRRWYEKKVIRNRATADEYCRKLSFVLDRIGLDADSVVVEAIEHPERLEDRLVRYASEQKERGRLDNYVRRSLWGLRSYLTTRRVPFDRWPELSSVEGASLEKERVPRPEELERVLARLSPRGRVVALMMAHAGVRPGVLGAYRGENGLRLGDLPELDLKSLEFREVPFVVRVPPDLSKTRVAYTTFGTMQLATAITVELGRRRESGEHLSSAAPLVAAHSVRGVAARSRESAEFGGKFLSTKAVLDEVRDALGSTAPDGVRWRAYVLRSYCSTRLLLAEGEGRISRDLSQAVLGHSTGVAGRYHVGKRWGEELLAEARREYARAAEFLETTPTRKDSKEDVLRTLLQAVEQATGKKSAGPITGNDLVKAIRDALGGASKAASEGPAATPTPRPGPQRVVSVGDLERLINDGWTYVAGVGTDRAIVAAPLGGGQAGIG